jgi:hypothetical protein
MWASLKNLTPDATEFFRREEQ